MREHAPLRSDVSAALILLFGPDHPFREPARLPDTSLLKKTFRRRSLAVHPDRALALGRRSDSLTREFQILSAAYRLLLPLADDRPRMHVWRDRPAASSRRTPDDFFWTLKSPPAVPLRFAQYVYYRGLVSYKSLIRVLVRQMRERPLVGELALAEGLLNRDQVRAILASRRRGERFLQTALRLSCLDAAAARAILSRQRTVNLPIGEMFIREGLLTPHRRDALLEEFRRHNRSCAARAAS